MCEMLQNEYFSLNLWMFNHNALKLIPWNIKTKKTIRQQHCIDLSVQLVVCFSQHCNIQTSINSLTQIKGQMSHFPSMSYTEESIYLGNKISAIFLSSYWEKDIRVKYDSTGNTFCIDFLFTKINPINSVLTLNNLFSNSFI